MARLQCVMQCAALSHVVGATLASRSVLSSAGESGGGGSGVDALLQELLSQNWRLELDAGLGTAVPEAEVLLIVCSCDAASRLHAAFGGAPGGGGLSPGAFLVLRAEGTAAGEAARWDQLHKKVVLEGSIGGGGVAADQADGGSSCNLDKERLLELLLGLGGSVPV